MKQTNDAILKRMKRDKKSLYTLDFQYEDPKKAVRYFCTPKGAWIFGSLGVDGVHYCTIPSLGDGVYVVNPSPADDRYVLPVAADLADFCGLVTAMRGCNLLDQMTGWDRATFEAALAEMPSAEEAHRAEEIAYLREISGCEPVADPWGAVHALSDGFDDTVIPRTAAYYETLGLVPHAKKEKTYDFVSVIVKHIPRD